MTLDTRLPLLAAQGASVNLADIYAQSQQIRHGEQQMQQRERALDQQDQSFELQMQRHIAELGRDQREAAREGVKDLAAAVQWAKTPEQWAIVQQHYAQFDPELAQTPFEAREQALVALGQMGQYLENTAPEIRSIEAGGSLAAVDPRTGQPTFTVLPNPGGMQPGAPAGSAVQEGATATNPQTGEKIMFRGGQWVPMGGGGGNAPGNFLGQ